MTLDMFGCQSFPDKSRLARISHQVLHRDYNISCRRTLPSALTLRPAAVCFERASLFRFEAAGPLPVTRGNLPFFPSLCIQKKPRCGPARRIGARMGLSSASLSDYRLPADRAASDEAGKNGRSNPKAGEKSKLAGRNLQLFPQLNKFLSVLGGKRPAPFMMFGGLSQMAVGVYFLLKFYQCLPQM